MFFVLRTVTVETQKVRLSLYLVYSKEKQTSEFIKAETSSPDLVV